MILDISIACILKYSLAFVPLLESLFYRHRKVGLYVPEELKADVIKFLQGNNKVATLDCDAEIFTMVKTEDRGKLTNDNSLKKVIREKLIKITFKEYVSHFKKLVYVSSDINLIKDNFKNCIYYLPDNVFCMENQLKSYNKDLVDLMAKDKKVKKKTMYFNCKTALYNLINGFI
jgi:hypothetical protein